MEYNAIAVAIENKLTELMNQLQQLNPNEFESIWKGEAKEKLLTDLKNTLTKINNEQEKVNKFAKALHILYSYKITKQQLDALKMQLSITSSTPENASAISNLKSKISTYASTTANLKKEINNILLSFQQVSSTVEKVTYQQEQPNYIVDLREYIELFKNGNLKQISNSGSLYKYVSEQEVKERMNVIKENYTGRDAVVNSALGIVQIAAEKGMKLDYDLIKGTNRLQNIDGIATGSDCCTFASWALSQGSNHIQKTYSTTEFMTLGQKVDYSQVTTGDIYTNKYSGGGHVMLVVENHLETNSATVEPAAGREKGIMVEEMRYKILKDNNYIAQDLSGIYA